MIHIITSDRISQPVCRRIQMCHEDVRTRTSYNILSGNFMKLPGAEQ